MARHLHPEHHLDDLAIIDNLPDATLQILAWDISDAIAKTADEHGIDVGMNDIAPALADFLADVMAYARKADS